MNGLLTLAAMGFGAVALGGRFARYSVATMAVVLAAGWLLWVAVLAITVLRRPTATSGTSGPAPDDSTPRSSSDGG